MAAEKCRERKQKSVKREEWKRGTVEKISLNYCPIFSHNIEDMKFFTHQQAKDGRSQTPLHRRGGKWRQTLNGAANEAELRRGSWLPSRVVLKMPNWLCDLSWVRQVYDEAWDDLMQPDTSAFERKRYNYFCDNVTCIFATPFFPVPCQGTSKVSQVIIIYPTKHQ